MPQGQTATKERQGIKIKEPGSYKVILFNDDLTPMDFVIEILVTVFFKSSEEAEEIMLKAHNEDKATVGVYCFDIAKSKVERAMELSRTRKYPLKLTFMPE